MKTESVISAFGSVANLASVLGISDKAVYQWGDSVPKLRQYELALLRPDLFTMPSVSKEEKV